MTIRWLEFWVVWALARTGVRWGVEVIDAEDGDAALEGGSPDGGEDEGGRGAEEAEGERREAKADASPEPDRDHREGGEAGRLARKREDGGEVEQQCGADEGPSGSATKGGHGRRAGFLESGAGVTCPGCPCRR